MKPASAQGRYGSTPGWKHYDAMPSRRLPVVPTPVAGEAFASWVDRTAIKLNLPPGIAARALGLEFNAAGTRPRLFGIVLTPASLSGLQTTTGLPTHLLEGMQLARYQGTALDLSRLDLFNPKLAYRQLRHAWLAAYGSRACPHCLSRSPAWPLWWRLGIAAVCPIHRCLLIDTCPTCGTTLRRGGRERKANALLIRPHTEFEPEECGSRSSIASESKHFVCRQRLPDIPTREVPDRLVRLQERALAIADGGATLLAGEPVPAAEWFGAMRYLTAAARLVVHDDELAELPGFIADALAEDRNHRATHRSRRHIAAKPETAAQAGAVLALTAPILDAQDRYIGALRLAAWTQRLAERRRHPGHSNPLRHLPLSPILDQMMTATIPRPYRVVGAITTTTNGAYEFRHIPHLIDPDDYRDIVAVHFPCTRARTGRHIAALALARLAGAETWLQAAAAIDRLRDGKGGTGYLTSRVSDPDAFWAAIQTVADRMRARGLIDYAARRTALVYLHDVPHSVLFPIFNPLGMDVTRARQRHSAAWIWQRLTGGDSPDAPVYAQPWNGSQRRSIDEGRKRFHAKLPEAAATALTSWGLSWLAERGVK